MLESVTPVRLFQAFSSPAMERAAIEVLRSGQIASGSNVARFEDALAQLIGRQHVVATNDMTSALVLALRLSGVKAGDEVLTLAFSCMSSNSAIALVGARPVWVDVDPETASISIDDLERAITPRTRALTLYHVAGYPAAMNDVVSLCRAKGITVIEDCNAALGAEVDGKSVGQFGDYAVLSFYPNRQVNALEGGALICPTEDAALRARRLRRFGIDMASFRDAMGEINPLSDIPEIGHSASFSNLNAAVGLAQLDDLASRQARTRLLADRLRSAFADGAGVKSVRPVPGAVPAYWTYLALLNERDATLARLKAADIQASKLHFRNDRYSGFGAAERPLPGTSRLMDQVLAIPCGWWLSEAQIDYVAKQVTRR